MSTTGRWSATSSTTVLKPALRLVTDKAQRGPNGGLQDLAADLRAQMRTAAASHLSQAWTSVDAWEHTVEDEFGDALAEVLVLLWSVHRFGNVPYGPIVMDAVLDWMGEPADDDPLLDNMLTMAFALGASWAEDRRSRAEHEATEPQLAAPLSLRRQRGR